jgi:hypothetical protein
MAPQVPHKLALQPEIAYPQSEGDRQATHRLVAVSQIGPAAALAQSASFEQLVPPPALQSQVPYVPSERQLWVPPKPVEHTQEAVAPGTQLGTLETRPELQAPRAHATR